MNMNTNLLPEDPHGAHQYLVLDNPGPAARGLIWGMLLCGAGWTMIVGAIVLAIRIKGAF